MMLTILLAALATSPASVPAATTTPTTTPAGATEFTRLYLGAQTGFPLPFGLTAQASVLDEEQRPRYAVDVAWEPSPFSLQSLSLGGAYHPLANPFRVGLRLRWLQLDPPWRGGTALDQQLGVGAEAGGDFVLGAGRTWLLRLSAGLTVMPQRLTHSPLIHLSVGVSRKVLDLD